jgi:hypothetical protein
MQGVRNRTLEEARCRSTDATGHGRSDLRVVSDRRLGYPVSGDSPAHECEPDMADDHTLSSERLRLALLIWFHILVCCLSLVLAANEEYAVAVNPATFHLFFDPRLLYGAALVVALYALVALLFTFGGFSFGYFVGFYFYTMVLGYLWLNCFTDLKYNHRLGGLSAAVSVVAFLLPALFISSPLGQVYALSARAFDRLLTFILLLAVATLAAGAVYNFRLVAFQDIYDFRNKLEFPTILNYLTAALQSTLLPFAFAGFVMRKAHWRAGAVLFLLLFSYPITLSKLAFLAPFWLVAIALASRFLESRVAVIVSLLGPILLGVILLILFKMPAALYFSTVNIRILAIPAVAMNVYNDFFSRNDLTYFCQVSFLKPIMACPYQDQLSIIMAKTYGLGNFNASLFATEGIASVGPWFAPVSALLCGLVIALGNRLSAGLPPRFILISGAVLPLVLLNVPLSTVLVTHGMAILFLLWYITPRMMFEPETRASAGGGN